MDADPLGQMAAAAATAPSSSAMTNEGRGLVGILISKARPSRGSHVR